MTSEISIRGLSWLGVEPIDNFSTVLTVFSDGTFTVASDAIDTEPAGMERGTYVYDTTTGNATFTTTVDTNGAFGVNDSPTLPAVGVVQANLTATLGPLDSLRITEAPNEFVDFDRVRVP